MLSTLPVLLSFACSEAPPPAPSEVVSVQVMPEAAVLKTGPAGGEPQQFTAWVTLEDGAEYELEIAEWGLSNASAGAVDAGGLFTPSTENGGVTWVTAALNGVEGSATATVIYEEDIVEEGADPDLFLGQVVEMDDPWLYPEDGVNIPRNTPSLLFEWADEGVEAWRLRLQSEVTDLTIYTTGTSWTADEDLWASVAATNAGGEVAVELSAAYAGQIWQAPERTIQVNRLDAFGSIYYWSSSASGFMKIPYGGEAEEYLTVNTMGHCAGCHDISSTGLIAFTYDGGNYELGVKRVDDTSDVLPWGSGVYANFKTFSPDGAYLMGTYNGALTLYDGATIEYLGDIATPSPATHVAWSPDGTQVAVVLSDDLPCDWCFSGGRLAVMDHLGDGTFGAVEDLYVPPSGYNAYYPTWSPDGEWIAFNISTGDSYDDEDAAVWVMPAAGGEPIELFTANYGEGLTNSWPRWAPLPDDDILWLTFASKRPYGTQTVENTPQIWVAAFDPERAWNQEDPSWPAFWLPGQDVAQNNHIPLWVDE